LRAVGKDGEHVTLGPQVDIMSGLLSPGVNAGVADIIDGYAHEEGDVAHDVSLIELELLEDRREIIVQVSVVSTP